MSSIDVRMERALDSGWTIQNYWEHRYILHPPKDHPAMVRNYATTYQVVKYQGKEILVPDWFYEEF